MGFGAGRRLLEVCHVFWVYRDIIWMVSMVCEIGCLEWAGTSFFLFFSFGFTAKRRAVFHSIS